MNQSTTAYSTLSYNDQPRNIQFVLNTYETTNRKLENFLFVHDIFHKSWYKSPTDGLTVWVYEDTEELRRVVAEYMELADRRAKRRTQPRYLN